jgi:acyl transferase domain-containing protein
LFDRRDVRRRVCLPTYPFERQRFWVEAAPATTSNVVAHPASLQHDPAHDATTPHLVVVADEPSAADAMPDRYSRLVTQLQAMFEDVSGIAIADSDGSVNFIELGLDSLMLTQVASQLHKAFAARITFRQLMGECASLEGLAAVLDGLLPPEAPPEPCSMSASAPMAAASSVPETSLSVPPASALASITGRAGKARMDAAQPIIPGARLGREPDGRPGWFIVDPARPGRYLKVGT